MQTGVVKVRLLGCVFYGTRSQSLMVGASLLLFHQSNIFADKVHLMQHNIWYPSSFKGHGGHTNLPLFNFPLSHVQTNTAETSLTTNQSLWTLFFYMLSLCRHSVHVVKVLWNSKGFVNAAVIKGKLLLSPRLDGENVVWKQKSKSLFDELRNDDKCHFTSSMELYIAQSEWDYGDILNQWWQSLWTNHLSHWRESHTFLQHQSSDCITGASGPDEGESCQVHWFHRSVRWDRTSSKCLAVTYLWF